MKKWSCLLTLFFISSISFAQQDSVITVFGEVVRGIEVIDKIAAVPTSPSDRPLTDVKIIKAKLVKRKGPRK